MIRRAEVQDVMSQEALRYQVHLIRSRVHRSLLNAGKAGNSCVTRVSSRYPRSSLCNSVEAKLVTTTCMNYRRLHCALFGALI